MQNDQRTPDIVVGIDFGMTCTGMFVPYPSFNTKRIRVNRCCMVPRARLVGAKNLPTLAGKNDQRARKQGTDDTAVHARLKQREMLGLSLR